jgi:hypothetical protein
VEEIGMHAIGASVNAVFSLPHSREECMIMVEIYVHEKRCEMFDRKPIFDFWSFAIGGNISQ